MGRARGTAKNRGASSASSWPPELRDLQRRGGMAPDWHDTWHGRGEGISEIQNPGIAPHALWSRIQRADEKDLREIWKEVSGDWPQELSQLEDGWIKESLDKQQRHLPGAFVCVPGRGKEEAAQLLLTWADDNPEEFTQFLQEEVFPGIRNEAPVCLEAHLRGHDVLWEKILSEGAPETLPALRIVEEAGVSPFTAKIRYLFAWNAISAVARGVPQEDAAGLAAASTIRSLLQRIDMDGELRSFLQREFPACRDLLPPPHHRGKLWDYIRDMFEDQAAWRQFAEGALHFEKLLCQFLKRQ